MANARQSGAGVGDTPPSYKQRMLFNALGIMYATKKYHQSSNTSSGLSQTLACTQPKILLIFQCSVHKNYPRKLGGASLPRPSLSVAKQDGAVGYHEMVSKYIQGVTAKSADLYYIAVTPCIGTTVLVYSIILRNNHSMIKNAEKIQ